MQNEAWDYKIDGKNHGIARLIFIGVPAVFFTVLTVDQLKPAPNKYIAVALGFAGIAAFFIFVFVYLLIRYFCYKIYIGKNGFYFQSNPFNGRYFKYSDIKSCEEELKVYRHKRVRSGSHRTYHYYFSFVLKNGQTQRVQFEKSLHEREINILKERIENSGGIKNG